MKKISVIVISIMLCTALLAGCSSKTQEPETESVVENDAAVQGSWTEPDFESGYEFNADGTGRDLFWDLAFTYTAVDGMITLTYDDTTYGVNKFSYSVDGSTITMTRQSDNKAFSYTKN